MMAFPCTYSRLNWDGKNTHTASALKVGLPALFQTPAISLRLEDGRLLTDSMPTPEELSASVAGRFRYDGGPVKLDHAKINYDGTVSTSTGCIRTSSNYRESIGSHGAPQHLVRAYVPRSFFQRKESLVR